MQLFVSFVIHTWNAKHKNTILFRTTTYDHIFCNSSRYVNVSQNKVAKLQLLTIIIMHLVVQLNTHYNQFHWLKKRHLDFLSHGACQLQQWSRMSTTMWMEMRILPHQWILYKVISLVIPMSFITWLHKYSV